ncbi:MerR family transcriptional regulator [Metabacillus arenae]|uniref:MerR family transcriptional regulator n=1 Tax=Metabacillus arenae TaxID=2771434 RepID=UPI001CD1091B|nr:MerR family transcriptional regulator [Metabacillus arenae]
MGKYQIKLGCQSTLCDYYEKEGILPVVTRNESGIRIYETKDIELLKFICCLRATGMSISDLKEFVRLAMQGDETIDLRINMLKKQNENLKSQVDQLMSYQEMIKQKINWYHNIVAN